MGASRLASLFCGKSRHRFRSVGPHLVRLARRWGAGARVGLPALALGLGLGLGLACGGTSQPKATPLGVQVAPVVQKDVPVWREWVGTMQGYNNAKIRSQVKGYLLRRVYAQGSVVKPGQLMFEIDPREFQAQLEQALSLIHI